MLLILAFARHSRLSIYPSIYLAAYLPGCLLVGRLDGSSIHLSVHQVVIWPESHDFRPFFTLVLQATCSGAHSRRSGRDVHLDGDTKQASKIFSIFYSYLHRGDLVASRDADMCVCILNSELISVILA